MRATSLSAALVILNWNGRHHLERFLPEVLPHKGKAKVYVIDNGSQDDSLDFLRNNYSKEIEVLALQNNGGFCGGYNQGLAHIYADVYILLNNDIALTPGCIDRLLGVLEQESQVAACQPKILNFVEKDVFEYAGAGGGYIDKHGYPFCKGRVINTLEKDHGQYNEHYPVAWATGACFAVRSSVYKSLGGLDEDFFAHMEEIDLCWRIQHAGFTVKYIGDASIYHLGGGTLRRNSSQKTYLNFRNGLFLLHKNYPGHLPTLILKRLILDGLAAIYFMLNGHFLDTIAVLRAHIAYYKALPKLHKKRQQITPSAHLLGKKSILWHYYVLQKRTAVDLL